MSRYINSFQNNDALETAISSSAISKPYVAYNETTKNVTFNELDYKNMPLTVEMIHVDGYSDSSNIQVFDNDCSIEGSKNGGEWVAITTSAPLSVTVGDKIQLRGTSKNKSADTTPTNIRFFYCNMYGNILSLYDKDNWQTRTSFDANHPFGVYFASSYIVDASNVIMPSFNLNVTKSFQMLFQSCGKLEKAPKLPATTIGQYCYSHMFDSCTSLKSAPELPATTINNYCYQYMFASCSSLISAPDLPANPGNGSYGMPTSCYYFMFSQCTKLRYGPTIYGARPGSWSYGYMFYMCTNLRYVKLKNINASYSGSSYLNQWMGEVTSKGLLEAPIPISNFASGSNGIPTNWIYRQV